MSTKYFARANEKKGYYQIYKRCKFFWFTYNKKVGREDLYGNLPYHLTMLELGEEKYKEEYGKHKTLTHQS